MKDLFLGLLAFSQLQYLASNDYATRESASQSLEDYGYASLPALRFGSASKDAEVKARCDYAMAKWFMPSHYTQVPIWYLPDDIRFAGGKDLALKYYKEAQGVQQWKAAKGDYRQDDTAKLAMSLYVWDRLNSSNCKQEIFDLHYTQEATYQRLMGYNGYMKRELDAAGVPLSLEERTKVLDGVSYKYPETGDDLP